jgi:hypothetical protein
LGSELARASPELKEAFSSGLEELISALLGEGAFSARSSALIALSTMVGALVLSRATSGPLSDELLHTARSRLSAIDAPVDQSSAR